MKVGVIYCGWGTKDLVAKSLTPWVDLRRAGKETGFDDIYICAVSVRFAGFEGDDDGTRELLRGYLERDEIDHLVDGPDNIPETFARSMCLNHLKERGCDVSVMWDSDEETSEADLARVLGFIDQDQFSTAWRFSYRNLVFDEKTWLADPFTPMRAHRLWEGSYRADKFYDDNNILYRGTITRDFRQDVSFATVTIPQGIFFPKHHTWLNDTPENKARSKAKIRYQLDARNWPTCSFAWDDSQGGLIFNPALPAPRVIREA